MSLPAILGALALLPVMTLAAATPAGSAPPPAGVRAQVDTVGFANYPADMAAVFDAATAAEGAAVAARRAELGIAPDQGWVAAVCPHDDYVYAGRVYLHVTAGLKAPRWVVFGVCHACRKLGVRDRLLFDSFSSWRVGGADVPVDTALRAKLLERLGPDDAIVADDRQAAEHSVEALLPWLRHAQPGAEFVSVLVPGMTWERMQEVSGRFAEALAAICREQGWLPGRDVGILVSSDSVHYGCAGWGDPGSGYHPFGCDASGHAAAVAQDQTLAQATLAGPLTDDGISRFVRLVWKAGNPQQDPYKITWCGVYSIPFGLATAERLQAALKLPPLTGSLLRYGDSVTDPRLTRRTRAWA